MIFHPEPLELDTYKPRTCLRHCCMDHTMRERGQNDQTVFFKGKQITD